VQPKVSSRREAPPSRRIPRGLAVLVVAFVVYTGFRLAEMTWWLIRAIVR
jgi:hypothetical protein